MAIIVLGVTAAEIIKNCDCTTTLKILKAPHQLTARAVAGYSTRHRSALCPACLSSVMIFYRLEKLGLASKARGPLVGEVLAIFVIKQDLGVLALATLTERSSQTTAFQRWS